MKGSYKEKALSWFLRFTTLDIAALSDLDFKKLKLEAEHHFYPRLPILPKAGKFDFNVWASGATSFFPETIKGGNDWRELLSTVKAALSNFLENNFLGGVQNSFGGIRFQLSASFGVSDGAGVFALRPKIEKPLTLDGLTNCAKLNFAFLLSGVPKEAVKRCAFCGVYFLNLSARKKVYCTQRCASRAATKAARKRDYEAYKEKQRNYMKKRYRERAKREHGSKVKVGKG
jgi:hypothetical protein